MFQLENENKRTIQVAFCVPVNAAGCSVPEMRKDEASQKIDFAVDICPRPMTVLIGTMPHDDSVQKLNKVCRRPICRS